MIAAARWPGRSDPVNSHFFLPVAIGRIWFSTKLLSAGQVPVVDVAVQRLPAREAVVDRLDRGRAFGHLQSLLREPQA
jgi:hypothetical protein